MRRAIVIFLCACIRIASAQQYGMQWVIGDRESVLDFRNDTLKNYPIGPVMPMFLTSANICDSSGNLLYYTNGIYIDGSDGNQLINGDSINPCDYTNQWSSDGLNIPQAALFLPKPGDPSRYYLLHFSNDTANGNLPGTLFYTQIRDSGLGVVEQKNVPFGKGIFRQGGMTACKHANGRDWWVVMGLNNSNEYFKYLVTPDSIFGPDTQSIGPGYYLPLDLPYSKFSQDGSKYVTSCVAGPILVMDFDRCNGEFSNPIIIYNQDTGATVEFSPDARFVYATNSINLTQFDLSLPNPQHDSVTLYQTQNGDEAQMGMLQLAPNNKLYTSCFNGGYYLLHAVNYPDSLGTSCDYVDTDFITLTVNTIQLPNMVNYQLAALPGPCDTITGISAPSSSSTVQVNLYPNPAKQLVNLSFFAQTKGQVIFEIFDELGETVISSKLADGQTFAQYSVSSLSEAIYYWRLKDGERIIKTGKVAIMK
jgi:Secretion system C-terminal sorting domain